MNLDRKIELKYKLDAEVNRQTVYGMLPPNMGGIVETLDHAVNKRSKIYWQDNGSIRLEYPSNGITILIDESEHVIIATGNDQEMLNAFDLATRDMQNWQFIAPQHPASASRKPMRNRKLHAALNPDSASQMDLNETASKSFIARKRELKERYGNKLQAEMTGWQFMKDLQSMLDPGEIDFKINPNTLDTNADNLWVNIEYRGKRVGSAMCSRDGMRFHAGIRIPSGGTDGTDATSLSELAQKIKRSVRRLWGKLAEASKGRLEASTPDENFQLIKDTIWEMCQEYENNGATRDNLLKIWAGRDPNGTPMWDSGELQELRDRIVRKTDVSFLIDKDQWKRLIIKACNQLSDEHYDEFYSKSQASRKPIWHKKLDAAYSHDEGGRGRDLAEKLFPDFTYVDADDSYFVCRKEGIGSIEGHLHSSTGQLVKLIVEKPGYNNIFLYGKDMVDRAKSYLGLNASRHSLNAEKIGDTDIDEEELATQIMDIAERVKQAPEEYKDNPDDPDEDAYMEVHLQVTDEDGWTLHTGSGQYLTDLNGDWGYGTVGISETDHDRALSMARDLISEAAESYSQREPDEEVEGTDLNSAKDGVLKVGDQVSLNDDPDKNWVENEDHSEIDLSQPFASLEKLGLVAGADGTVEQITTLYTDQGYALVKFDNTEKKYWVGSQYLDNADQFHADNPEPDEENDIIINPEGDIYYSGQLIGHQKDGDTWVDDETDETFTDRDDLLKAYLKRSNVTPNIWSMSDHGNYHLVTLGGQ